MKPATHRSLLVAIIALCLISGCGKSASESGAIGKNTDQNAGKNAGQNAEKNADTAIADAALELSANDLLEMRLPAEQSAAGWIRLFDGFTLYGWEAVGPANWSVKEKEIRVSSGEKSLLCTSLPWQNFELMVEYQADATTNSGIFLRTPIAPENPAVDCYELNIAPTDNPFPTGSLVGRRKLEPSELGPLDPATWHSYVVRVEGDAVSIQLDGKELYTYTDPTPLTAGRIALQHNSGQVAFRNVLVRPLGMQSLFPAERTAGSELAQWKQYPEMPGSIDWDEAGNLHVRGGKRQLETVETFANFALLAQAKTNGPKQNSGIFFRCIPGEEMNGYECQINNDAKDDNRSFPADCGTGGIFRRQDARLIAADPDEWFSLMLIVSGPDMTTWVNGVQVSEWRDTREPDPNPRRGKRLDAGTLMLQGHDATTDVKFKAIDITRLP